MNLFEYLDYRSYLRDYCENQKVGKKYFSKSQFCKMAGLGSTGYLKMVIDGKRNLSPNTISKFVAALKLESKEAAYFEVLVLYNQTKSKKDQENLYSKLLELRPAIETRKLEKAQFEYFRFKYFVIIREMLSLPHFIENYEWIAKNVNPPIRPFEAQHAIESLLKLQLLKRDSDGKLCLSEGSITTTPEVPSLEVFKLHKEWLNLAKESFLKFTPAETDYTGVTIPVAESQIPKLKKIIEEFRSKVIEFINRGNPEYDEVYQMNVQLFPVTTTKK